MKPHIIIPIGIILFTIAVVGGVLSSKNDNNNNLTKNVTNQLVVPNANIGIPQTYGKAIVFTGKVIPFTDVFQPPNTTGWKSHKIFGTDVLVDPNFTSCYWDLLGPQWYFVKSPCEENQDANSLSVSDITKKVQTNDPDLKIKYAKDVEVPIEHQFRSDEVRGTVNGNAVWCYDDIQARYCEIRRSDGKVYFATGGYYHEAGPADQESFKSVVLALTK